MRPFFPAYVALFLVVFVLAELGVSGIAEADTTIPISGIGTSITEGALINTHVDEVTCSEPVDVFINGLVAVEIRGMVSGVGWGGSGIVPRAGNTHYQYNIPFVARWPKHSPCSRLVFFNHGGGRSVMDAVKREKEAGAANENRFAERNGDLMAGVSALVDHAAYISINRRGLRGDGTFSATCLAPVAPLTAAEVNAIQGALAAVPGNGGFVQPGLEAGAPVPVVPTNDAATCRDMARALEQVVAGYLGKPFDTRIGVGTSSGARLFAGLNFGRSVIGTQSLRTGGNHVVPYDVSSPRIFDAFILIGFPYVADVEQADPEFPLSAPVMFLQGLGDERYQQHVSMAHELLQKGVLLNGSVWLYEVKNLTHVSRDSGMGLLSHGDRLGCFLSAAIRNLREFIEHGRKPPVSRMAGRIINGDLRIEQGNGATTNVAPVPNVPGLDSFVVAPDLTPRNIGTAETTRWREVTAALPHTSDAITPPSVACRIGGYQLLFFGSRLVPFSRTVLTAKYGSFECYRQRLCAVICRLEAERLYDSRVESACETAEFGRAVFN